MEEQTQILIEILNALREINKNVCIIKDRADNPALDELSNPNGHFLDGINSLSVALENFKVRY